MFWKRILSIFAWFWRVANNSRFALVISHSMATHNKHKWIMSTRAVRCFMVLACPTRLDLWPFHPRVRQSICIHLKAVTSRRVSLFEQCSITSWLALRYSHFISPLCSFFYFHSPFSKLLHPMLVITADSFSVDIACSVVTQREKCVS